MQRGAAWLWFLALLITLWASNPSPTAYSQWLQGEISSRSGLGHSPLARIAGVVGAAVAGSASHTRRTNLGIASLYVTRLGTDRLDVLAVASRFLVVGQRGTLTGRA